MKKIIFSMTALALLSSCAATTTPDKFNLNIKSSPRTNNGNNYLVIYEQPSSLDKMAQATYNSLSKRILDNDHQTKLIHPQNMINKLTFKAKDEPAAIYFIMDMGKNYNTWRYYIPNPDANSWDCSVDNKGYTSCKENGE